MTTFLYVPFDLLRNSELIFFVIEAHPKAAWFRHNAFPLYHIIAYISDGNIATGELAIVAGAAPVVGPPGPGSDGGDEDEDEEDGNDREDEEEGLQGASQVRGLNCIFSTFTDAFLVQW